MLEPVDHLEWANAHRLAERIREFWLQKGHVLIETSVHQIGHEAWAVRSNMVNGFPPKIVVPPKEKKRRAS